MPLGDLGRAFRSDWPALGRPHSFAQPSVYQWGGVARGERSGARLIMGLRHAPLPPPPHLTISPAIHLTGAASVAATLLKDLTATEYSGRVELAVLQQLTRQEIDILQEHFYKGVPEWEARCVKRENVFNNFSEKKLYQ